MKNIILIIIMVSLAPHLLAEEIQRIRTLVRFEKSGTTNQAFMIEKNAFLPTSFKDESTRQAFHGLDEDSEAFIEGYVDYKVKAADSLKSLEPIFIVESVYPVSLNKLGAVNFTPSQQFEQGFSIEKSFEPTFIPVTTEVASAITMTTTLLLMESLSNGGLEPEGERSLRKALIISSGLMATMLFIYEQIEGKSRP